MRITLVQSNPTVGDLEGNTRGMLEACREASARGADLVVFPELAIAGYPPRDLLDRASFVDDVIAASRAFVSELPSGPAVAFGAVRRSERGNGRGLYNAVVVARRGEERAAIHKRLLPTYDVFDEDRWFDAGPGAPEPIGVGGVRVGFTICEDAWNDVFEPVVRRRYEVNPVADQVARGAEVVVNVAASPFTLDKRTGRAAMLADVARHHSVPVLFCNQVGGNDDLLFDGASEAWDHEGRSVARAKAFDADAIDVDVGDAGDARRVLAGPLRDRAASDEAATVDALVMGTRDYARKCGFRRALLGLSGGVDSALVAAIAARALGPENVLGVALPTRYSSAGSVTDARALATALGIELRVVDIDPMFQAHLDGLGAHVDAIGAAGPTDVTWENVQSRIRCATLMALSNRSGALLLTTGNKSEIAVGYCTLYGDMAGGLAVISDLPKTFVYRVAREINRQAGRPVIPESTLTKAPSAELRPNQTDQDSLPPYEVLDAVLERYVEDGASPAQIIEAGFDRDTVTRVVKLIRLAEYKRRQMAPGLIVTSKAFGPGRRYPIAHRYRDGV